MKNSFRKIFLVITMSALSALAGVAQQNPLFKETKVKNYIPHMSWYEVEQALKRTDMVLLPVGSIEQHGKHLPLGTDSLAATERCKLIAQQADVLVAPTVLVGLSEHHMAFPGSMTLSPATFEAVVFESARSLIHHGFRKVMIYNGHGGNATSVSNVVHRINQETPATAVFLNNISMPASDYGQESTLPDHAGEGETSLMLYLTPSLVDMSRAEMPVLTFPEVVQKAWAGRGENANLDLVASANLFRPIGAGKKASTREMSNIGVFSERHPKNASAQRGKQSVDRLVQAAVEFIEAWKKIDPR
jgi:creatinine amidohydrolase